MRLSRDRFQGGVGLDLEVLEAQEALTDARTAVIAALVDYDVAQIRLLLALGSATEETLVAVFDGTAAALDREPADGPEATARTRSD